MTDDSEFTPAERATLRQMLKAYEREKLKKAQEEAVRLTKQLRRNPPVR